MKRLPYAGVPAVIKTAISPSLENLVASVSAVREAAERVGSHEALALVSEMDTLLRETDAFKTEIEVLIAIDKGEADGQNA